MRDQAAEIGWLLKHPDFRERPATFREFLGPDYLNMRGTVRDSIEDELAVYLGEDSNPNTPTAFKYGIFTGAIGIGKTTVASIVLAYTAHWLLCLNDINEFYGMAPDSLIALMLMSTTEKQAKEVLFRDLKVRIKNSPWFQQRHPVDPTYTNQIRFENSYVWILPGTSKETSYEGYNILGGIIEEADSHAVTEARDYAELGFHTISTRMTSRFNHKGFIFIIGQMKESEGFAARRYKKYTEDPKSYSCRMTIWESRGDQYFIDEGGPLNEDGTLKKFWFDTIRRQIIPAMAVPMIEEQEHLLHIPEMYRRDFIEDPTQAMKDLAGIPPTVQSPFIAQVHKILSCTDRWVQNQQDLSPVNPDGGYEPWFRSPNNLPRVGHLDIGFSIDAAGFAMGHIERLITIGGEENLTL